MHKLGLKLWSTNDYYIKHALSLYDDDLYDYIELYAVPDSYEDFISKWKEIKIPFIIHAPHFLGGLNFSKREYFDKNVNLAGQALKYADALRSKFVIFHPGIGGEIKETARQINLIKDSRIIIENKPYFAVNKKYICNGSSPEEISFVVNECAVGFCLDIGHCFCSANAKDIDPMLYLQEFLKIGPSVVHISDGHYKGLEDDHLHLGHGNFDLTNILMLVDKISNITIETDKDSKENLEDFRQDAYFLKNILELKR
ncbi:MAG: TIM barrel protein [Proteobacteria bacterium]|nr:TIM barrel protein [Pseudomonadota bacterium]